MTNGFGKSEDHPRRIDKERRLADIKEMDLGTLVIIGAKITIGERSRQYVMATCSICNETREMLVDNILGGKTTNCRCQRGKKYNDPRALILGQRYDAIKQRCENPGNQSYRNYGDIGIECRFEREDFIFYMLASFPTEDLLIFDIDRINNQGHYEKGNLRLIDRAGNLRNKSTNKIVEYNGRFLLAADLWNALRLDYPEFMLSKGTTARLAADGIAWRDILLRKARPRRS